MSISSIPMETAVGGRLATRRICCKKEAVDVASPRSNESHEHFDDGSDDNCIFSFLLSVEKKEDSVNFDSEEKMN